MCRPHYDFEQDSSIRIGIGDTEYKTYDSKEAFIADFDLQAAELFYQYYDRFQNLELELYCFLLDFTVFVPHPIMMIDYR